MSYEYLKTLIDNLKHTVTYIKNTLHMPLSDKTKLANINELTENLLESKIDEFEEALKDIDQCMEKFNNMCSLEDILDNGNYVLCLIYCKHFSFPDPLIVDEFSTLDELETLFKDLILKHYGKEFKQGYFYDYNDKEKIKLNPCLSVSNLAADNFVYLCYKEESTINQ